METTLPRILTNAKMAISLSEARRQINSNMIKLNGFVVNNPLTTIKFYQGDVLEAGKRKVELNSDHLVEE